MQFFRMKKKKIIGIDYSLTRFHICVCRGSLNLIIVKYIILTNVKKYEGDFGNINGRLHHLAVRQSDTVRYRIGRFYY